MAHARKDTYVKCREWWKHLKPFGKRDQNKRERKCAKERIKKEF